MPQIANQDYNLLVDKRVTGSNSSDVIAYGIIRALNRGTIWDVIVETGEKIMRPVLIQRFNGNPQIRLGQSDSGMRVTLTHNEETYATYAKISEATPYPSPTYMTDENGFLYAGAETYISCSGNLVKVTEGIEDDEIKALEISDTPVGERSTVELTPEEVQTLVGTTLN